MSEVAEYALDFLYLQHWWSCKSLYSRR